MEMSMLEIEKGREKEKQAIIPIEVGRRGANTQYQA